MSADFQGYLASRNLLAQAGPFLIWAAVFFSWASLFLSPMRRNRVGSSRPASWCVALSSLMMAGGFVLLVWYHWRIYDLLPLELPEKAALWVNSNLYRSGGGLGPINWNSPPRFAIPFWIEGEKLFFWTLALSFVVLLEQRRENRGYRFLLSLMLALQATSMALFASPFTEPLPKFHGEITTWFSSSFIDQARYFFQIFPRMKFYYNSFYMWVHPPALFIAYATLASTFASSVFTLSRREPPLEKAAYGYAKVGYLLLTFGMLVGYPWAIIAWGPNWWWDPKIASSIMMWLLYSAYLHHRFLSHHRHGGWQTAGLGILCYLSLIFTYFMSWYFPGEHTF